MVKLIDIEKIKRMDFPSTEMDGLDVVRYLNTLPTVDAVPVDQIRVGFRELYLKGQEVVMNVSICGKNNDVRIPFSKDVVEVVRCKDCKYWMNSWVDPDGKREHGYCNVEDVDDVIVGRWGGDFCSYGERKTDG